MTNSLRHRIGRNQLTTLEENLMNTTEHPSRRLRSAARRGARGLTLIELGFVIIILAVIVAVALTFYNTVSTNKKVSDTVSDVASIRSAMAQYAGGLPLIVDLGYTATDDGSLGTLQSRTADNLNWKALNPFLSGRLYTQSLTLETKTMANANAWQSTYEIVVLGGETPYYWNLTIDPIPVNVIQRVREKLATSARGVPVIDGNKLTVEFEVGA